MSAIDGVGTTCTYSNAQVEEWDEKSLCNALHATKTGVFGGELINGYSTFAPPKKPYEGTA